MTKEIVIARYNEDTDWISNIEKSIKVYLYNKSDIDIINQYKKIPNIGREAETFLRHIVENYDSLSDIIIFSQGNPIAHCKSFIQKINSEYSDTLIYLSDWIPRVFWTYGPGTRDEVNNKILRRFNLSDINSQSTFSAGAQYLVNSNLIKSKNKEWWNNLYKFYIEEFVKDDVIGYQFERIWPILYNNGLL